MKLFTEFADQIDEAEKYCSHLTTHSLDYVEVFVDGMIQYLNSRFFSWTIGKVTYAEVNKWLKLLDDSRKHLSLTKNQIIESSTISQESKKFLIQKIQAKIKSIQFHKIWLYIEAQKCGFPIQPQMHSLLADKAQKLYSQLYWPTITESPYERDTIIHYFHKVFSQNKGVLSEQDQIVFQQFLDQQQANYKIKFNKNTTKKNKDTNSVFETKIPIEKVQIIFQKVLEMYWLEKMFHVMIADEIPNFCVRSNYKWYGWVVWIPGKTKSFSVKQVCSLIDHEINNHVLRGHNRQQTINIVSDDYLTIEEGFASLSWSLTHTNLEDITLDPIITNCCLYIAECFDFEDSIQFIKIYMLLIGQCKSEDEALKVAKNRALRAKRYVPFHQKWANRKDVTYWRGMHIALENVLNNPNIADYMRKYYLWKISEEDFDIFEKIMKEQWISSDAVILPIFVGKIIADKLSGKKITYQSVTSDPRMLWVKHITFQNAKKLVDILDIFREEISWSKK